MKVSDSKKETITPLLLDTATTIIRLKAAVLKRQIRRDAARKIHSKQIVEVENRLAKAVAEVIKEEVVNTAKKLENLVEQKSKTNPVAADLTAQVFNSKDNTFKSKIIDAMLPILAVGMLKSMKTVQLETGVKSFKGLKFNPYHDSEGRFTTGSGSGAHLAPDTGGGTGGNSGLVSGNEILKEVLLLCKDADKRKKEQSGQRKEITDRKDGLHGKVKKVAQEATSESTNEKKQTWLDSFEKLKGDEKEKEKRKVLWDDYDKHRNSDLESNPEYKKLSDEYDKTVLELATFEEKVKSENKLTNTEIEKILTVPESERISISVNVENGLNKKAVLRSVEKLSSFVSKNATEGKEVFIGKGGKRSHYHESTREVFIGKVSEKSIIHEMGHWLEHSNPHIMRAMGTYRKKVTEGAKTEHLGAGYEQGEIYKKRTDKKKWINDYMGKIYQNSGATELLSVGLEHYTSSPVMLAKKDPELFVLIANAVRGNL